MVLELNGARASPPLSRAEEAILANLTAAMAAACPVVCVSVVAADDQGPSHVAGDGDAARALPGLPGVRRALAEAIPARDDPAAAGGALAGASFIAIEPIAIHGAKTARVVVLAGKPEAEEDRTVALLHALAMETAGEMTLAVQAPFLASGLSQADCGITIADPNLADTPLIFVNDTFTEMTGYAPEELVGRNCRFLQGHLRDQPQVTTLHNAVARGLDCTVTLTNIRKDGSVFANRLKLRAVRSADGALAYYVGVQLDVTAEQHTLEELQEQKQRYESLVQASASYIWHFEPDGQARTFDEGWLALAGLSPEKARTEGLLAALVPAEAQAYRSAWTKALADQRPFEIVYHLPAGSPEPFWFLDRVAPVRDGDGRLLEWIGASQDITQRKRAENDLTRIIDTAPMGMLVVTADGTIDRANASAAELFGYSRDELAGLSVEALVPPESRERHRHLRIQFAASPETRQMGPGRDLEGVRRDGTRFPIEIGLSAYGKGNGYRVVATVSDITQRKKAEEEVRRAAYMDRLTGLYSRAGFLRRLKQAIAQQDLHPGSLIVAIDVRALRDVNNVRGYDGGDAVLQEVARRLRAELGEDGLAARISGDEFAALVPLARGHGPASWRRRLAAIFAAPFDVDGFPFHIKAVFGYARLGFRPAPPEELMRQAELALHESQTARARTWTQYTRQLAHRARRQVRLAQELRQGLDNDELSLVYQPKVALADGRVVAAEALMRWQHPERGQVSPAEFIPVAEESQLIGPIGDLALEHACRDLAAWRAAGLATVPVSVNVSLVQFTLGGFPDKVRACLDRYGLKPADIILEITESVFRQEGRALQDQLATLRAMGVRLSLDDFGTGYSSLFYLKAYPFDEIKIDKGFVMALDRDGYSRAIVTAVMEIADSLGTQVIAEGVESAAVADRLQALGCRIGQGFYYSRPLPEPAWRELLASTSPLPSNKATS